MLLTPFPAGKGEEGSTRVLPHGGGFSRGGVQSARVPVSDILAYARARRTRVVQRPVGRGAEEKRPRRGIKNTGIGGCAGKKRTRERERERKGGGQERCTGRDRDISEF